MGIHIIQGIISIVIILGVAPLFAGMVNKQKAILTGNPTDLINGLIQKTQTINAQARQDWKNTDNSYQKSV